MALRVCQSRNGRLNHREIARHIGVDHQTVKNWAVRLGVSETRRNWRSSPIVPTVTSDPTPEATPGLFERIQERQSEAFWHVTGLTPGRRDGIITYVGKKEAETTWVSTREAGRMLGVSSRRVNQLIKEGELVANKINPRAYMVLKSSVESYKTRKP